jgi:hypothetical protein
MSEAELRHRPFRPAALAVLMALAAVVLAVVVLDDDHDTEVRADGTTTTASPSTSTPSTTAAPTTTAATLPEVFDSTTPLDPRGVGPIEAGMTVAEAAAASGRSLTVDGSFEDFGGYCYYVDLDGQPDLAIRVHSPDDQPVTDPNEGVISAITIFDVNPEASSTRTTTAGIGLGATEAEVRAAHPDVDEQPHEYVPDGAYLYVHPTDAPGFGIRYVLDERRIVTSIDVGDEEGIQAVEGCA